MIMNNVTTIMIAQHMKKRPLVMDEFRCTVTVNKIDVADIQEPSTRREKVYGC